MAVRPSVPAASAMTARVAHRLLVVEATEYCSVPPTRGGVDNDDDQVGEHVSKATVHVCQRGEDPVHSGTIEDLLGADRDACKRTGGASSDPLCSYCRVINVRARREEAPGIREP